MKGGEAGRDEGRGGRKRRREVEAGRDEGRGGRKR